MKYRHETPEKSGVLELEIMQSYIVLRRFAKVGNYYMSNGQTLTIFANEKDWLIEKLTAHQGEPVPETPK